MGRFAYGAAALFVKESGVADDLTAGGVPVYRDSVGVVREKTGQAQLDALTAQMAGKADTTSIPQPATTMPMAERTGAALGAIPDKFARADHQHPRLTSTTYATLAADGTAVVAFSRTFVNKPGINLTETDAAANAQPLSLRGQSWVQDPNGLYTGVVIKGVRATTLPPIGQLSIAALLTAVTTGVNAIATALGGFNVFSGSVAGSVVSVIAVARSDVPAT